MKFFVTAIDPDTGDVFAKEIDAESFDQAAEQARELARQRFSGRPGRLTGVTETPQESRTGGMSAFLAGARVGELWKRQAA